MLSFYDGFHIRPLKELAFEIYDFEELECSFDQSNKKKSEEYRVPIIREYIYIFFFHYESCKYFVYHRKVLYNSNPNADMQIVISTIPVCFRIITEMLNLTVNQTFTMNSLKSALKTK